MSTGCEPVTIDGAERWFRGHGLEPLERLGSAKRLGWCKLVYSNEAVLAIEDGLGLPITMTPGQPRVLGTADSSAAVRLAKNPATSAKRSRYG